MHVMLREVIELDFSFFPLSSEQVNRAALFFLKDPVLPALIH
jgi:hypothetical protein